MRADILLRDFASLRPHSAISAAGGYVRVPVVRFSRNLAR